MTRIASFTIEQNAAQEARSITAQLIAALESAHEQMSQCEKMFRYDTEFVAALEEVRAALRSHGRIS